MQSSNLNQCDNNIIIISRKNPSLQFKCFNYRNSIKITNTLHTSLTHHASLKKLFFLCFKLSDNLYKIEITAIVIKHFDIVFFTKLKSL